MFSKRVPADLRLNELAEAARERGDCPYDLTVSNPTAVGIDYPGDLLAGLADPRGLSYRPDPRGLRSARESIAARYASRGTGVDPDRFVLCASTSEAYGLLFRLLCDPGDSVLVPVPSYPLFDHLAALDSVRAIPYPLEAEGDGQPSLDAGGLGGARALLVVHPNNPTGHYLTADSASRLAATCAETGAALVADEVFLDYPLDGLSRSSFAGRRECLTFTLGGLSKSVGLPQLKLAWIAVSGPETILSETMDRLEYVNDAYLSVATPVQVALPDLLSRGLVVRDAILARCRRNLDALEHAVDPEGPVRIVPPEGGWSCVLRYPALVDDETLAITLLKEDGVAVHPGSFFGFSAPGRLVVSLLTEPALFDEGLRRLLSRVAVG